MWLHTCDTSIHTRSRNVHYTFLEGFMQNGVVALCYQSKLLVQTLGTCRRRLCAALPTTARVIARDPTQRKCMRRRTTSPSPDPPSWQRHRVLLSSFPPSRQTTLEPRRFLGRDSGLASCDPRCWRTVTSPQMLHRAWLSGASCTAPPPVCLSSPLPIHSPQVLRRSFYFHAE